MTKAGALFVLALVLAAGCSQQDLSRTSSTVASLQATPALAAGAPETAEAGTLSGTAPPSGQPGAAGAPGGRPAASGAPYEAAKGRQYPELKPGESKKLWGDMPMELKVTPVCAKIGTPMKATIKTVEGASIGAAVRYYDEDPHGDYTWNPSVPPTGEHIWTWTIKPGVPNGVAHVMVAGGKKGYQGAGAQAAFEVASKC